MPVEFVDYETEAKNHGFRFIFGIDEAGRGPLAGPVVAAAVCLKRTKFSCQIDDSKKMTASAREEAFHEILEKAYVGIGYISEIGIDHINILNATFLAMERAAQRLIRQMANAGLDLATNDVKILVDGDRFKSALPYQHQTIISGDAQCLSIACASIVAKTYRDRIMECYDGLFPQYGFKCHKGYATDLHRTALAQHGPCMLHRKSFQGVLI